MRERGANRFGRDSKGNKAVGFSELDSWTVKRANLTRITLERRSMRVDV